MFFVIIFQLYSAIDYAKNYVHMNVFLLVAIFSTFFDSLHLIHNIHFVSFKYEVLVNLIIFCHVFPYNPIF